MNLSELFILDEFPSCAFYFRRKSIPAGFNGHKTAILPPSWISRPKDALTAPTLDDLRTKCGGAQYKGQSGISTEYP